jgi:acetyltransferase
MLVESLSDGERLRALAERSYQLNKPIVMVKVGRTEVGSRAAASHTGSITGADDVCDAALRQLGIIRVDDCNELYETAMLLRQQKPFKGRGAAATSISGGNLVMVADLGAALEIEWPQYQTQTCAQLAQLLPGFGATANPTDLTAAAIGQPGAYARATEIILQDPAVDVLIPVMTIASADDIRSVAEVSARSPKPMALLWTGCASNDPSLTHEALVAQGHAVYSDAAPCLKAVRRAMQYSEFRATRLRPVPSRPAGIDRSAARLLLEQQNGPMTEQTAKQLLSYYGVRVTHEYLATSKEMAVTQWSSIKSPVALKIVSPDILHKTEAQAIRLNLNSAESVAKAYGDIMTAALHYRADAKIEGVLVQEMVGQSHEMFVGMVRDPTFGPVMTFGLGGIYVEILKDLVFRLAPLSRPDILEALNELHAMKLLQGARGQAPADIDALVDCIERVSWLAADCSDKITEIDINPLCVLTAGQGVRVVDALVIL